MQGQSVGSQQRGGTRSCVVPLRSKSASLLGGSLFQNPRGIKTKPLWTAPGNAKHSGAYLSFKISNSPLCESSLRDGAATEARVRGVPLPGSRRTAPQPVGQPSPPGLSVRRVATSEGRGRPPCRGLPAVWALAVLPSASAGRVRGLSGPAPRLGYLVPISTLTHQLCNLRPGTSPLCASMFSFLNW